MAWSLATHKAHREDSGQTGRTYHVFGFVMMQLSSFLKNTQNSCGKAGFSTAFTQSCVLFSHGLVQGHSDSTFSNVFSLETAGSIEAKFHVDHPWDGGTKICSNGPGHMTKMTAMHIYGKNIKKSSSLETKGR